MLIEYKMDHLLLEAVAGLAAFLTPAFLAGALFLVAVALVAFLAGAAFLTAFLAGAALALFGAAAFLVAAIQNKNY